MNIPELCSQLSDEIGRLGSMVRQLERTNHTLNVVPPSSIAATKEPELDRSTAMTHLSALVIELRTEVDRFNEQLTTLQLTIPLNPEPIR